MSALGGLAAASLVLGALAIATWALAQGRPTVLARIAPGAAPTQSPSGALATIAALVPLPRSWGAGRRVQERLHAAGVSVSVAQFRFEQFGWAVLGGAIGAAAGLLMVLDGSSPAGAALLVVLAAVAGFLACDRRLTSRAKARRQRIDQQLPGSAELLAFAVGAGESPAAALGRVADVTVGDLAVELRVTSDMQRSGAGLESALRGLAERVGTPAVTRFVDGMRTALERGTPIAEVLRAQAADARAEQRRVLMEQAGRKDVLMLLPVVFLILPIVVVIAVYPGFAGLHVLVP